MPLGNRYEQIGRLTRDPELRVTPKGTALCNFGVVTNSKRKDAAGNEVEETLFVDWTAWGRQAEVVAKYFHKGDPFAGSGRLKLDQWEDKEGNKRSKLGVVMEEFTFLPRSRGDAPAGESSGGDRPPPTARTMAPGATAPASSRVHTDAVNEEDVPF